MIQISSIYQNRSWKDVSFNSIPKDRLFLRQYWLTMEAVEKVAPGRKQPTKAQVLDAMVVAQMKLEAEQQPRDLFNV